MPLIHVVLVLIVIGVLLWLVKTYVPMDQTILKIIVAVVVIATVIWLLSIFGLFDSLSSVKVPRIK